MTDKELAPQRAELAMVFQGFYLWPHLNVRDNVALGPMRAGGLSRAAAHELADAMLDKVHLRHKADDYPEKLSGGQQQRVAIARALAQRSSCSTSPLLHWILNWSERSSVSSRNSPRKAVR